MPRYRIKATDTVELSNQPGHPPIIENALERLHFCVEAATVFGAKLRQSRDPLFADVWRATLPNEDAEAWFRLAGADTLDDFRL